MANRVSQESVEALVAGSGNAHLSHESVEALVAGDGNAVVSQLAVEVLRSSRASVSGGVSQLAVEVLVRPELPVGFIPSATAVYAPALVATFAVPFIGSATVVHPPTLTAAAGAEVDVPFIASNTHVFHLFSLFHGIPPRVAPGNGGERFLIELNANGVTSTATLDGAISDTAPHLYLTGDSGFPTDFGFVVTIDDEVLYLIPDPRLGGYRIPYRHLSNTDAASHADGATVSWTDHYDMAITATEILAKEFTADIWGSGDITYPGYLIAFDSTQAYKTDGTRYPFYVSELLGVFPPGTGSGGSNRLDANQGVWLHVGAGPADACPAAMGNPSRLIDAILIGDNALMRYQNIEAYELVVGSRSAAAQSWFGVSRVDDFGVEAPTDTLANVIDGPGVTGDWTPPVNEDGISPDDGTPISDVPFTTVELLPDTRTFTYGPPRYSHRGWPMSILCVRQGMRRIPYWESYDYHNFGFVYSGWDVDATYAQFVCNRNGVIGGLGEPSIDLPGDQAIYGPNALWDASDFYYGVTLSVCIFGHFPVIGPRIGGGEIAGIPAVWFPAVSWPVSQFSPAIIDAEFPVEGGHGGGISPPGGERYDVSLT